MMSDPEFSGDGNTITVKLPLTVRKRGGRKVIIAPAGQAPWASARPRVDSSLVKAIARAYRWQRLLEEGTRANADEIAKVEKISASYVNRVLQLTLLSPAIVDMVLDGRQPATMTTSDLLQSLTWEWDAQRCSLLR